MPLEGHVPRDERTAPPLGGGERLELVADARLRLVAHLEPMTAATRAGTPLLGQCLPAPHAGCPVVQAQRAGEGQLGHAAIIARSRQRSSTSGQATTCRAQPQSQASSSSSASVVAWTSRS